MLIVHHAQAHFMLYSCLCFRMRCIFCMAILASFLNSYHNNNYYYHAKHLEAC